MKTRQFLLTLLFCASISIMEAQNYYYCVNGDVVYFDDFGSGSYPGPAHPDIVDFAYNGATPLGANGTYTIAASPNQSRPDAWHDGEDHTSGDIDGYCLVVNGSAGLEVYRKTVTSLDTSKVHRFGIWAANSLDTGLFHFASDAQFELRVEDMGGSLIASTLTGPISESDTLLWQFFHLNFDPGSADEVQLIINDFGAPGTNDYVIDDIELLVCPFPPPIPGMQDWALILFGLLSINLALILIYSKNEIKQQATDTWI